MKRGVTLLCVALLIVGAILFIMIRVHTNVGDNIARTSDSFVPENSDFIIKENSRGAAFQFSHLLGNLIDRNAELVVLRSLDTLKKRGVIELQQAERFAVSSANGDFVAVYKAKRELPDNIIERCFQSLLGDIHKVDDEYNLFATKDSLYCIAEFGEWLLIGNSLDFMNKSIMYTPRRDSTIMALNIDDCDSEASMNLYVAKDYAKSDIILDIYLNEDMNDFLAQGYQTLEEDSWANALVNQNSDYSSFDKYFPQTTIALEWLVLSDLKGYTSRLAEQMLQDSNSANFNRFITSCDSLLDGNVAQLVCENSTYLLLGVVDSWRVANVMESFYGAKKGLSLQLSAANLFGPLFSDVDYSFMTLMDDYIVLAESKNDLEIFETLSKNSLLSQEWYKSYKRQAPTRFSYTELVYADKLFDLYEDSRQSLANKFLAHYNRTGDMPFGALGVQGEYVADRVFMSVIGTSEKGRTVAQKSKKAEQTKDLKQQSKNASNLAKGVKPRAEQSGSTGPKGSWQRSVSGKVIMGPVKVINHNNRSVEWLVQDSKSTLYLFTNAGKMLWRAPIDGAITSDIVQVDRYKNGKLQYLFSTRTKIYLVDRNGVMVSGYPIKLQSPCVEGITLCDYDKNKNYRIFVPRSDRKIYLYDITGMRVTGWSVPQLRNSIVSPVKHFRVAGKDYIVVADSKKLYIFDRRGNIRVDCNQTLNLKHGTDLQLVQRNSKYVIKVSSPGASAVYIDFLK